MSTYKEKVKVKNKQVTLDKLELSCQECGQPIANSDININSTLAKCSNCGTVHFIEDKDFFLGDRHGRPEMMIPEGTEVLHLPSSLDIRIRKYHASSKSGLAFKSIFTLMWNVILFVFVGSMIASGVGAGVLFVGAHLAVGVVMLVNLLETVINYTDVVVDDHNLEISSKPISGFWNRPKVIPKRDIEQIYVSRYVSSKVNGQPNYAYGLYAILRNGKKLELIKGMNKQTQLYIEQELERYLGIEDRTVRGAIKS